MILIKTFNPVLLLAFSFWLALPRNDLVVVGSPDDIVEIAAAELTRFADTMAGTE
jgi:hypothetical protein